MPSPLTLVGIIMTAPTTTHCCHRPSILSDRVDSLLIFHDPERDEDNPTCQPKYLEAGGRFRHPDGQKIFPY
eukprot:scaffold9684_cov147-Skeletonema_dohrnii-CCMP3373.AAC.4